MSPARSTLDALRRYPDPATSSDPQVRALVDALGTLQIAPAPTAQFRADLRAQLVAVAPRVIEESAATAPPARPGRRAAKTVQAAAPRRSRARLLTVAASVITVLVLVLGGATWLSQKSLPGDTLYGLKRASESTRLAFASSPTAEANDRLTFATTRVEEARALVRRATSGALGRGPQASGGLNAHTSKLIADALTSGDADVVTATRQLSKASIAAHSGAPFATMVGWAPGQTQRLSDLAAAVPAGALRANVTRSRSLLASAWTRAKSVRALAGCSCMSDSRTDRLGAVPCTTCPTVTPATPVPATTPAGTTNGTHGSRAAKSSAAPATSGRHRSTGQGTGGSARTGSGSTRSGTPTPHLSAPKLPAPSLPKLRLPTAKASLPVNVTSCGISISVGPINAHAGTCPSPHK